MVDPDDLDYLEASELVDDSDVTLDDVVDDRGAVDPRLEAVDEALRDVERELLAYVLDSADGPRDCVDVEAFGREHGYSEAVVAQALDTLSPPLHRGAVADRTWYEDRVQAEALLAAYETVAGDG